MTSNDYELLMEAFLETTTSKTKGNEYHPYITKILDENGIQYAENLLQYCSENMRTSTALSDLGLYWSTKLACENWLIKRNLYVRKWDIQSSKVTVEKI